MFHQTLEYRYRLAALPDGVGNIALRVFLDAGSAWNETGHPDSKYSPAPCTPPSRSFVIEVEDR